MVSLAENKFQRNVIAFFGVNGVGKSVLADTLNKAITDSICVQASSVLRDAFGVDRQALEKMSLEIKMSAKIPALIKEFNKAAESKCILLDMHLIVSIRRNETIVYEDVWANTFFPYILKAYFIFAEPQTILERRKTDMERTGRKRNISIVDIAVDQEINLKKFHELFVGNEIGEVVDSTNRSIGGIANKVLQDLKSII